MNDTNKQTKQVIVDITIAAPIDVVWKAIRDPAQIADWFGWETPELAAEIAYIFADHATADETRRVVQFNKWDDGMSEAIELHPEGGKTRLRLVRSGGAPIDWTGVYEDITQGWINFFQQLRLKFDLHPAGEARRTIYLSGPAKPGVGEPSTALRLDSAIHLDAEQPYSAHLDTGDSVSGKVWYRTHFQTAVTVEQWGNGLLVVTDMGVVPKRPHGGGSVLLTTYGLSETEFAALEQRWRGWWSTRYEQSATQASPP